MTREPAKTRTLAKQFDVGFGIAVLLPLTVWYGVHLFHPPPERKEYFPEEFAAPHQAPAAPVEVTEKASKDREQRTERFEQAERLYYRDLFYVAYPVGLLAFVAGTFLRVQAVGAGFMFGGLFTLGEGCYSYWDKMGDTMRFGSLLVALAVVVALGCWRFRPNDAAGADAT
jgi:hypothetical protein